MKESLESFRLNFEKTKTKNLFRLDRIGYGGNVLVEEENNKIHDEIEEKLKVDGLFFFLNDTRKI